MPRLTAVTMILAAALLVSACGGAGDDRDAEVVTVERIDFTGVELTIEDFFDPPSRFVGRYPEIVAEVNGEPITAEALVQREVLVELNRRQHLDIEFDLLREHALADIEAVDPLEALIEDSLRHQAVKRLDFLPSFEEAVRFTREQEREARDILERASPEERAQHLRVMRLSGMPEEDWASHEEVVEVFRMRMGVASLRTQDCEPLPSPTAGSVSVTFGQDCSDFLEAERERAEIEYFVEWAD